MNRMRGTTLVEIIFAIIMGLTMIFPVGMLLSGSGIQVSSTRDGITRTVQMLMLVEKLICESGVQRDQFSDKIGDIQVEFTRNNGILNTLKFSSISTKPKLSEERRKISEISFERTLSVPEYGLIHDYELDKN